MELKDRKRKINIDSLPIEDLDNLSKNLGEKMKNIADSAIEQANKVLNVYGLSAKIAISIEELPKQVVDIDQVVS